MKKVKCIITAVFFILFINCNFALTTRTTNKNTNWTYLLDDHLSNFDKFIGVPHTSIKSLPNFPKGDGMNGTPLGLNNDPLNVFSVFVENKVPILHISGEIYGGLSSKKSYRNYHFSAKFKWGDTKYEPTVGKPRGSGILYHCSGVQGTFWNVWMNAIEFQVQEANIGDVYVLCKKHLTISSVLDTDSQYVYTPNSNQLSFGWGLPNGINRGRCKALKHVEKPNGEWNTLEIICLNEISLHIVNGMIVNVVKDITPNGCEDSFREGKIQIQCEGAEAFYKEIKIRTIENIPFPYANLF